MRKKLIANENYFENINSEEKAYHLGILYCIGSIHEKHDFITFDLKPQNIEILENLSKNIYNENTAKLKIIRNSEFAVLRIASLKMKNDLINLGRSIDKKLAIYPKFNSELKIHFIRGIFDVSGSCDFNFEKNKYNISFEDFPNRTKYLKDFFEENDIKYCITNRVIKIFTRITCLKFLDLIYKNYSIGFSSKIEKYNYLKFERMSRGEANRMLIDINIIDLYNKDIEFKEISRQLDIDPSTLFRCCRRLGLEIKDRVNKFLRIYYDRKKKIRQERIESVCTGKCKKLLLRKAYYKNMAICRKCWSEKQKKIYKDKGGFRTQRQIEMQRKNQRKYNKKRMLNPTSKIRSIISGNIREGLKRSGGSKEGQSCIKFLPYTVDQLKEHLEKQFEPWMNWNNWSVYRRSGWNDNDSSTWTWQIDHIVPDSIFNYPNMTCDDFKECWKLENLRPYSAKQNVIDGITKVRHFIRK